MSAATFTADARAIVTAASRAEGEDPDAVMNGRPRSRARVYAFVALAHRYPRVSQPDIMIACGADPNGALNQSIAAAQAARGDGAGGKIARWFSLGRLNAIVVAVGWPRMTGREACVRRHWPGRRRPSAASPIEYRTVTQTVRRVDVTASLMGDPSPHRSALGERAGSPHER